MKRIALVLHGLQAYTGTEVMFANLSHYINTEQIHLTFFIAIDPGEPQFLENEVKQSGADVIHLHDLDHFRFLLWPWTLYRAFKQYGPFNAVHANMNLQNGVVLASARLAGIPMRICHAHTSAHNRDHTSLLRRIYRSLMRSLIHRYANVRLACAEDAGLYYYGNDSFTILDNGIELSRFDYCNSEKRRERTRFIAVGRFAAEKNPFFLLDVFEAVYRKNKNAHLTWVGTGPLQKEIKDQVHRKGLDTAVTFLGQRKDIPELMREADIFLFPSRAEALGLALVEAQAAGLTCYASDRVPKKADCGLCRFLSLDLTAEEWAETILHEDTFLVQDRKKLERYDIRHMADRLTALYLTDTEERTSV
ncbi:MAG: glycosyltransferase [Solobacterium sp.]|nr:glycosyltransferase [Solobacterium sp.]